MTGRTFILVALAGVAGALAIWFGYGLLYGEIGTSARIIPTAAVQRGDVVFSVTATGELQGRQSEMLVAPRTGGRQMVISYLREAGELVDPGDVVVQFDTSQLESSLIEAEADLLEQEQELIMARANAAAREEEARYALEHAKIQVSQAELEVKKNPLVSRIRAQQNTLALNEARDRLRQLEQDLENGRETSEAAVELREVARDRVQSRIRTTRRNIEAMTVHASTSGYVAVQLNSNTDSVREGMHLPMLQVGDTVYGGMEIAEIPGLANWEVVAQIGELDHGHLEEGQEAEIKVVAAPHVLYQGHVSNVSGLTGPAWNRQFECKVAVENPTSDLRPGMTATVEIKTGDLTDALWVPVQALFESDRRPYVFVQTETGFAPKYVNLIRRGESKVVVEGISEGEVVALASPEAEDQEDESPGGVMEALPAS